MQKKLPWNIIVLLGSGFALAEACKVRNSGADLMGDFVGSFPYVRAKIAGIVNNVYVTGRGSQRQEREGFKDFSKAIYLKLKSISNTATVK